MSGNWKTRGPSKQDTSGLIALIKARAKPSVPKPEPKSQEKPPIEALVLTRPEAVRNDTAGYLDYLNKQVFKHPGFLPFQEQGISAILKNKDVFVCLPTGGGKSLIYQLPAVFSQGITLVIMPLLSLILNQVQYLQSLGISLRSLNASQSLTETERIYNQLETDKNIKILFLTPEKLAQSDRLNSVLRMLHAENRIDRLVVDEAHCVSQWGKSFRIDYLKLTDFRVKFPGVPILALTATATPGVRQDIITVLSMKNTEIVLNSFNRPNLYYEIRKKSNRIIEDIAKYIKNKYPEDSGIIYCSSRADCQHLGKVLKRTFQLSAWYYHGEMAPEERIRVQTEWMRGDIKVLAATVAFGMGIDKRDVRFVVHYSFPKNIDEYYQQTGRAGRDGEHSECVLFFKESDKSTHNFIISNNLGVNKTDDLQGLRSMIEYCNNDYSCRRKSLLKYFGEEYNELCEMCDNCLKQVKCIEKDVSEEGLLAVEALIGTCSGYTLIQLADFLKGDKKHSDSQYLGSLKQLPLNEIKTLLQELITRNILTEALITNTTAVYTVLIRGPNSSQFLARALPLTIKQREFPSFKRPREEETSSAKAKKPE